MELEPKKISELTEEQRLASLVALRGYKSYVGLGIINISIKQGELSDIFENTIGVITASYQFCQSKDNFRWSVHPFKNSCNDFLKNIGNIRIYNNW